MHGMPILRLVPVFYSRLVLFLAGRGVAIVADYPTTLAIVFSLAFIIGRFSGSLSRVMRMVVRRRKDNVML
jgi:hypothetical protein